MDTLYLKDLKVIGHEWIDAIHALGIPKPEIYRRLRKRLRAHNTGKEHFGQMKTTDEAYKAVVELSKIYEQLTKPKTNTERPPNPLPVPDLTMRGTQKPVALSYEAQKAAYEELRRRKADRPTFIKFCRQTIRTMVYGK